MSESRFVLVEITDPDVTEITLRLTRPSYVHTSPKYPEGKVLEYEDKWTQVPVPEDDQLRQDLDAVSSFALATAYDTEDRPTYRHSDKIAAAAMRLRARFNLDEGSDNE